MQTPKSQMNLTRVFKNTFILMASQQLARAVNFVQFIVLIRYLGKGEFGIWSLTQAIPGTLSVLMHMGMYSLALRIVARNSRLRDTVFSRILVVTPVLMPVYLGTVYLFSKVFHYEAEILRLIVISALASAINTLNQLIAVMYRAQENFFFDAILNISRSFLLMMLAFVVIFFDLKLIGLIYGLLIVYSLIVTTNIVWYRYWYGIKIVIESLNTYTDFVKSALPFAAFALVTPIFIQIDTIMLSKLSTYEAVGIYNVAFKIVIYLMILPNALRQALFPNLSLLFTENCQKHAENIHKACRIICLIGMPLAVSLFFLADEVIDLLFPAAVSDAAVPLQLLGIMLFFYYLRSVLSVTLITSDHQGSVVLLLVSATALNIVLDLALIPQWDATGAALGSLISEVSLVAGCYFVILRKLYRVEFKITAFKLAASAIVVSGTLIVFDFVPVYFRILAVVTSYLLTIWAFQLIRPEEYRVLSTAVTKSIASHISLTRK